MRISPILVIGSVGLLLATTAPVRGQEPRRAEDAETESLSPAVVAAKEQLALSRERYQAGDGPGMVAATMAGLQVLGDVDEAAKLRASLWYWAAVGAEYQGDFAVTLERFQRALVIQEEAGLRREVAATLNSLGNTHGYLGDRTAQLDALIKSRDIFEEIGEVRGRAAAANSLGNYFADMKQPEEALPYHEQSVALRRTMEEPRFLASGLMNLGITVQALERLKEAEAIYHEALGIYREIEDPIGLSGILTNLGSMVGGQGRYDEALAFYQEALGYDRATGYTYGQAILTRNLGATYHEIGNDQEALPWMDQAVELARGLENPERLESAYRKRAEVREALADYQGALADWQAMSTVLEAMAVEARKDALLELQTKFETAEKQRAIDRLEREAVEQELTVTRAEAARAAAEQLQAVEQARRRTTLAVAIGTGVAALILAGLFRVTRRSERRLAQKQAELEQALAGLRAGHAELKKLYARKSEWLGFAVHDLRSPLFAIDACCAEIVDGLIETPVEGVREIRGAALRMREELDAWLDAERQEQTEIQVHPVPLELGALVADVVGLNQPAARAKDLTLDYEGRAEATVRADAWRWREVVDNLISNAIKFSPRGARVVVESGRSKAVGWVRVRDEGPGLSPEDRENLFGAFARLSAQPTGGETSTGLGLHLVQRLVMAHGGEIKVTDAPGGGAIFEVSVPLES
ncbi:tetratricopeptide repeat-containing sensor histidine kinase [Synoicihabitans lomoniglobus]|uniref:histidine kinase n=1 Tax=Synoicihabitans lomoniglobus TaxID=2909285 RepID=A0AAF0CNN1_9BACT|nr:tetratricopeptide repeat-containing sensor histidine kinase [Opitutaceae bacterium LMO-M01]WED64610.1 tetratricopeptide repeat-containing sensor histidine kinase [Opitutaceae bacterium LMO-M01]